MFINFKKLILSIFLLSFASSNLTAKIAYSEFRAIIADHRIHFKQKYPNQTPLYFRLGKKKPRAKGKVFLVTTGEELLNRRREIGNVFRRNPETALLLDVKEGDGSVKDRIFNLCKSNIPEKITSLWLSNVQNDVTQIGWNFLEGCTSLKSLDLSPLGNVTQILPNFLHGCTSLETVDLSLLSNVAKVRACFLEGCTSLETVDLSFLSNITQIGDRFLTNCTSLKSLDLSPLSNVTRIEWNFLEGCTSLKTLDLSPLSNVTIIGDRFLANCTSLESLDFSHLSNVVQIGWSFLSKCISLKSLDLSHLSNVTQIGPNFLKGCSNLVTILNADQASELVLRRVVDFLRESNNPLQQAEGAKLYQTYLLQIPEEVKALMAELNLDLLKEKTPQALEDLPDFTPEDVVDGFDNLIKNLQSYVENYNAEQTTALARLSLRSDLYEDHLKKQLLNLFSGPETHVTWSIRDDQRPEVKVGFKHLLKELQRLSLTDAGQQEAITYVNMLLKAFLNCESRYVSELNNILLKIGLGQKAEEGHLGTTWKLINNFKVTAFQSYANDGSEDSHRFGRKFTVVNNAITLPVAVRSFEERMSKISDKEMQEILGEFLSVYFNKNSLIEALYQEFSSAKSPLTAKQLRSLLGKWEGREKLMSYVDNVDGYYVGLGDFNPEKFDFEKTAFSKKEVERLLVVLGVVN